LNDVLKTLGDWLLYAALFLAAAAAMLLGKADTVIVERLRAHTAAIVAPVLDTLSRPFDTAADGADRLHDFFALADQNAQLRHEREQLVQWQAVAERLAEENAVLRRLLNVVPEPGARYLAARVIADTGGVFARSLILNAGTAGGVQPGHIVVSSEGLVGRIAGAATGVSRVVLVTDLNSRVPVTVGNTRVRAILAGNNTDRPALIHLDTDAAAAVGDRVVTSGVTGAFPPGLPVGVVVAADDHHIAVAPFFESSRLEFVRVIDHGMRVPSAAMMTAVPPLPALPAAVPAAPAEAAEPAPAAAPATESAAGQ
jgi:rod shape-determining protein MreC